MTAREKRIRFATNLVIGVILVFVMQASVVQQNSLVVHARDAIVNWQMARLAAARPASPLILIDIDRQAAQAWRAQEITPRDKLARLIAFAAANRPKAIVVDIDLRERSPGSGDSQLVRFVGAYNRGVGCAPACAPLIFARPIRTLDGVFVSSRANVTASQALPTIVDPAIATTPENPWNLHGNVRFGTVETDSTDATTRSWRLWETTCRGPGPGTAIPSAPLLVLAGNDATALQRERSAIAPLARACSSTPGKTETALARTSIDLRNPFDARPVHVELTEEAFERRFFMRIGWRGNGEAADVPEIGAEAIAAGRAENARGLFADKIVFIGSTFGNDYHYTPLGRIPGVVIQMNELNSLLAGDSLREPSPVTHYALEIALVVCLSALLATLATGWALALTATLIALAAITLGLAAFNLGIFVDSIVPLAGIFLHEIAHRAYHGVKESL